MALLDFFLINYCMLPDINVLYGIILYNIFIGKHLSHILPKIEIAVINEQKIAQERILFKTLPKW